MEPDQSARDDRLYDAFLDWYSGASGAAHDCANHTTTRGTDGINRCASCSRALTKSESAMDRERVVRGGSRWRHRREGFIVRVDWCRKGFMLGKVEEAPDWWWGARVEDFKKDFEWVSGR